MRYNCPECGTVDALDVIPTKGYGGIAGYECLQCGWEK